MIPILNKASLALAIFALYKRAIAAQTLTAGPNSKESLKTFLNFNSIWYFATIFWLTSAFFIYAQSLAMPLDWYLQNSRVQLKIFLCLTILGLEAYPLFLFTKWQLGWRKDKIAKVRLESTSLRTLVRLSFIELILTALLTIISLI